MSQVNSSGGPQPAGPAPSKPAEPIRHEAGKLPRVPDRVVFRSYWKFMFVWPIIVLGYLFWPLSAGQGDHTTLLWIWSIALILVLVTIGLDLGRNMAVFWIVLIALFWVSVMYLKNVHNVMIFTHIHQFIDSLGDRYPRKTGLFISIVLSAIYLVMIVWVRLNQTWRFTHNEFEHFQFGRSDDSLSRGTKKVKVSYHDFFEFLLCMSGTIVISNSTGTRDLRVIDNVPLAPLRWRKIDRMLASTAVTSTSEDDEEGEETEG